MTDQSIPSADHYDVAVIGAGQGGIPIANAFARTGRRVALIERTHVGGTCINEGCTPTKTIIASARVAYLARRSAEYGVQPAARILGQTSDPQNIRVDLQRVHDRKQHIVDSFRSNNERGLAAAGVHLIRGQARFTGPKVLEVHPIGALNGSQRRLAADIIIINTGLRPAIPQLPGLDHVPYLTSTTALDLTDLPEHLIILGGGYVGLEFAQAFRRFGNRVTIVHRDAQLLPREDADIAEAIADVLRDDGIDIILSADAGHVDHTNNGGGVRLAWRPRGETKPEQYIDGTHLLIATGRIPNTVDLGLDAAGVLTDNHGYVHVNDRLETSAPGIYAIGDAKGGPAFTHISYDDFRILRTNILDGGSATTSDRLIPYTVFIDPQLGAVGMTEREARASGRRVRIAKLPMKKVARAIEVGETRGFMKAVVDADSGRILGARVFGIEGGEIATLFQIAMLGQLPYTTLRDGVFSHPTLAEALNNLFTAMERENT